MFEEKENEEQDEIEELKTIPYCRLCKNET